MNEEFMRLLVKGNCSIYSRNTSADIWRWYQATPLDKIAVEKALKLCSDCAIQKECLIANFDHDAITAGGYTAYERKMLRWKRVDSIERSNWRKVSSVVRGIFREEK